MGGMQLEMHEIALWVEGGYKGGYKGVLEGTRRGYGQGMRGYRGV